MASHVVVIDSSARRTTIKTTPQKYLSDVLEEACSKLGGLAASQYGLKHNNKPVDTSRTIRLSGLSSGAKLELVQLSKSAGVVSVALQLPESEAQGQTNARLTDKFPSTTTLWLILRKFETATKRNLTARGAPGMKNVDAGTGRLYYQRPVLQVMGRELSSFTDLQKSLAQLGLNGGTALLRLSFRTSDTPLEEAMTEIEDYFTSTEGDASKLDVPVSSQAAADASAEKQESTQTPEWTSYETSVPPAGSQSDNPLVETTNTTSTSSGRPLSVFLPPSSTTPAAVTATPFNPADYTPTVEHAQIHQRMLSQSTGNKRLPSEAEIAAQQELAQEKLAGIKEVDIKVRFPDESSVVVKFGQNDTGRSLYNFVREDCLDSRWVEQKFDLRNPGFRGQKGEVIADSENKKLIRDLGLKGRVLVVFSWAESATAEARTTKEILKAKLRQVAQKMEVKDVQGSTPEEEIGTTVTFGANQHSGDGEKKKGGVPKWLKGLSKK